MLEQPRTRRTGEAGHEVTTDQASDVTRAGAETMMMAGTSTQWEWGWGSGGGWLCGAWCLSCEGDAATGQRQAHVKIDTGSSSVISFLNVQAFLKV